MSIYILRLSPHDEWSVDLRDASRCLPLSGTQYGIGILGRSGASAQLAPKGAHLLPLGD